MSRAYKNTLNLRGKAYGQERRKNLAKEILKDSTPLPKTLLYKDIDKAFSEWVENDLYITFEGEAIPTISLYSNQRFSEYMQTWEGVDEKKNIILNFKAITRENNPKLGTIVGPSKNIPGEHSVLMKTVEAFDKNNRKYYIDYRLKQPTAIDFIYTVSLVTNKYELLNEFNLMMNDKFKSIQCYIRPNGHFIPMILNDISDESEYSIDNRQYYSQTYNITVKAYIITEDDYIIEEIKSIKQACQNKNLKVIIETDLLSTEEIKLACELCIKGGADFVKTSTGFSTSGASVEAVSLMRRTVGTSLGVKASGGIHSFEEAVSMVNAGATRLGCSASLKIIK